MTARNNHRTLEKNGVDHLQNGRLERLEILAADNARKISKVIWATAGAGAVLGIAIALTSFTLKEGINLFHEVRNDVRQTERVVLGHTSRSEADHRSYERDLATLRARHEHDVTDLETDIKELRRRVR